MTTFIMQTFSGETFLKDINPLNSYCADMTYNKSEAKKFHAVTPNEYTIDFLKKHRLKIKLYPCRI